MRYMKESVASRSRSEMVKLAWVPDQYKVRRIPPEEFRASDLQPIGSTKRNFGDSNGRNDDSSGKIGGIEVAHSSKVFVRLNQYESRDSSGLNQRLG
jgi:hypothetical protein